MNVQVFGCSHHDAAAAVRERLVFPPAQARSALDALRQEFPKVESVLLSTCNLARLFHIKDSAAKIGLPQRARGNTLA